MNGDKDALDEPDDGRKEDKNGYKTKFMFNIADGGFTGKNESPPPPPQNKYVACSNNWYMKGRNETELSSLLSELITITILLKETHTLNNDKNTYDGK